MPDHPRVGGEHKLTIKLLITHAGSSPRGRGTPDRLSFICKAMRIIPAWAGNTSPIDFRSASMPDHPRVGGEHSMGDMANAARDGSSPRGRGTRRDSDCSASSSRIIPAWAGNTRDVDRWTLYLPDHPRVGGEHASRGLISGGLDGSSPRGRGTHGSRQAALLLFRIIPAWAGNTLPSSSGATRTTDHPRVGGEHSSCSFGSVIPYGSSPRGRGTPR